VFIMKVAVWYGGKDIKIEDAPIPKLKDKEVLVKVKAVTICGSDLHAYMGVSKRRVPPLVMGHEFSGEVAEIGSNVRGIKQGERVVIEPVLSCGKCKVCLHGRNNICENMRLIGLHMPGAFAEYVSVPADKCHKLSENISFEEGSLVEPLAVAVHALNRTSFKKGDKIVIIGSGTIGLMTLQVTKLRGAGSIFIIDTLDYKLELAKKLGADKIINAKNQDSVKEVLSEDGADVVFEAVGRQKTVQQALSMVNKGGKVTVIGMLESKMELDMLDVTVKEIEIRGSYGYTTDDFKQALKLISTGKVKVKSMITHTLPLRDISKGFEILSNEKENAIKVVLKP
jgi:2-desacetyl-2-hydroxyethyl bacteriochlorophyllide A dehydrogenase